MGPVIRNADLLPNPFAWNKAGSSFTLQLRARRNLGIFEL